MRKKVKRIIRDVPQHWVGDGFPVRSLFSYADGNRYDPFLLLDYAGPQEFDSTTAKRGVGEHPHRGFETVTIVYQGELEHRDSSGSHGTIGPGDVQWMTAASGVVHEEFHSERFAREGGTLEMIQIWVNLPAKDKLSAPRYQGLVDAEIPRISLPWGTMRVIAGEYDGISGAAKTFTPVNVWDLQLEPTNGTEVAITEGHTSLIVVQSGSVRLDGAEATSGEVAVLEPAGKELQIETESRARLLVLTGEPIAEPVVGRGPFVMNLHEEIIEAVEDYRVGRMGRLADG